MDERARHLERRAGEGDVADRAAFLASWLRADPGCEGGSYHERSFCEHCLGTRSRRRWRVELAAYVGDRAAQQVVAAHLWIPEGLRAWVRDLRRFGRWALVRAALAAASAAAPVWIMRQGHQLPIDDFDRIVAMGCAHGRWCRSLILCLRAVDAWIADPTPERLRDVGYAVGDLGWIENPPPMPGRDFTGLGRDDEHEFMESAILQAVPLAGEDRVRDTIRTELVRWCLPT